MTRLLTWEEKGTGNPSIMMGGGGVSFDLVRVDLEQMSRASVLLPFSLRKFLLIQLRMSSRQVFFSRFKMFLLSYAQQ